ncbi:MAG TPA: amidohydrolase, partial [Bacteroidetes bacterium]|nr:amidohydrolase [Bacteroidota bacterium]
MRKIFVAFLLMFVISCSNSSEIKVLHNINGYSMTNDGLIKFNAIAMQDGKILSVGSHSEIISSYGNATSIDGGGRTVLPGLIDAHAHVMGLGSSILNVNVMGIQTLDETLQMVSDYAVQYPDLAWIQGRGWNQVLWPENTFPTSADLDRAVSDRPVFLSRVDGHAGWANSEAMRIAGITRDTPDPDGGAIIKDENGEPTGV